MIGSACGIKMSKGRIGRRWLGLAVAGVALVAGGSAFAELGQPAAWEYKLQEAASPVMENITWFHNFLTVFITFLTIFVLVLLVMVVVKFNAKANPVPSRTTHNTLIEVAWTLVPVLILVGIAVPSFRLLFLELDIPKADLTIKATGKQWYWSYAYPDNGKFECDSLLACDESRTWRKGIHPADGGEIRGPCGPAVDSCVAMRSRAGVSVGAWRRSERSISLPCRGALLRCACDD